MPGDTEDRPPQADLPEVLIADLPAEHALCSTDPAALGKPEKRKRLVFVGDVHGHLSALQALLKKINFDHRHGDHLVFVGDIVAKGPDSAGVVKLAMEVGASGVRGNHEDNVLLAHKDLLKKKKQHHKDTNLASEDLTLEEEEEEAEGETDSFTATRNKHADNARAVARSLSAKQIKWLSSLPIVLRIGQVTNSTSENIPWNAGEIAVVHAGLVPGLAFEDQDPWAMMNMRTLLYPALDAASDASSVEDIEEPDETIFPDETFSDDDSEGPATTTEDLLVAVPSDTRQGEPWSHAWNRYQNTAIPSPADRTIKGIRYAFGIDSGCGHGRQLTALVLETGPKSEDGVLHHIEQVDCGEVEK
ncbi:Metallo-dependent phosphatase-like protein [Cercophora newfieldiana]|uniref:Metallo-dependent phosphatase-like protein n=1 Tax=Cercophora newfieldiana TaxID=92897 RepID=A0AA39YRA2_9PEZI|nr:Metallo-dependent phosphatase-like protein [Cercophora newfieldiana]